MRTLVLIAAGLALSACAGGAPVEGSTTELERLAADCHARGGILTPSGLELTGRPAVDNVCRISGGASRISKPATTEAR